jgi:hypothetical protein
VDNVRGLILSLSFKRVCGGKLSGMFVVRAGHSKVEVVS